MTAESDADAEAQRDHSLGDADTRAPVPIHIERDAKQDLALHRTFYESRSPGLGDALRLDLDWTLERIGYFPYAHQPIGRRGEFRRAVLRRFPYSVVYRVTAAEVQILGIFPSRADPTLIVARLLRATRLSPS